MFKVMVVEDEPPIARSVRNAIENADADFTVAKICRNGREAVETLETEDYDIVFTDIRMPIMTGLELAGWIYKNKPGIMTVILSGYSDFEYAKKALAYKVFDYILKPVSKEKISELAERIRSELGAKRSAEHPAEDRDTAVVLACAGAYLLYGSEAFLPGANFWSDDEISRFMEGILKDDESFVFFNSNIPSERYIVIQCDSPERQDHAACAFYERFCGGELPITVVYRRSVRFRDAAKSFNRLREHLIKSLILDCSQLICVNDTLDTFGEIAAPYSKSDIESLTAAIKNGDGNEVRTRFSKILSDMRDSRFTQEEINGFLNVVLDTYALNYPQAMQRKNTSVKHEFVNALASFTSYDAFFDDIVSILMTLRRDVVVSDRNAKLADSVEEYLKANYNKDITGKTLAREFGFVPSYISRIFKRNKGV
ncbi:MAG: response regulator, partial [Clostridia bacterium]|nr:response regulator [Clostridia bacterium]